MTTLITIDLPLVLETLFLSSARKPPVVCSYTTTYRTHLPGKKNVQEGNFAQFLLSSPTARRRCYPRGRWQRIVSVQLDVLSSSKNCIISKYVPTQKHGLAGVLVRSFNSLASYPKRLLTDIYCSAYTPSLIEFAAMTQLLRLGRGRSFVRFVPCK